jgi:hypothetical protein
MCELGACLHILGPVNMSCEPVNMLMEPVICLEILSPCLVSLLVVHGHCWHTPGGINQI